MRTKLLYLFITCVCSASLLAQVPTPYASFPFDDNFMDENQNVISQNMGNLTIVDDAVRGKVANFPGGAAASADSINYLSMGTDVYNFDGVTYNCWFNGEPLMWSRIFTAATLNPDGVLAEAFCTPSNGRLAGKLSWTVDAGTSRPGNPENDPGKEMPWPGDFVSGTWYMVTFSQDETNMKLWIDGVLVGDSVHTAGKPSDLEVAVCMIGKAGWPDPLLQGMMDNFKVFDKVLSDAEVAAIYEAESVTSGVKKLQESPNLIAYNVNNEIYIKNKANAQISSVQIYNVTGSMVLRRDEFTGVIRHNLPPSIYIVKIQSNLGDFISKILVE